MPATVLTAAPARRRADTAALALLAAAGLALVALLFATTTGHRVLVVRSGSMAPAIATGDAIVVRTAAPQSVLVGDVVTFRDPSRGGQLLTHRVREVVPGAGRVSFVTQGDANTGTERWSIGTDGTVGLLVLRLPTVGYALTWLAAPWLRGGAAVAVALLAGAAAVRRIWAS